MLEAKVKHAQQRMSSSHSTYSVSKEGLTKEEKDIYNSLKKQYTEYTSVSKP